MGAAAHDPLDALVIGAGFSGLYTLHRLVRVGYGSVWWRWPKTSAGPGYTTETRAHVATSRASNTPTASAEIHALSRIDIRDRDGMSLGEFCCSEGRSSYFGLAVGGFLNLFTGAGPGQSQRGRQLRRGSGAVCGVDQRLHCLPARQRISRHRSVAECAATMGRPRPALVAPTVLVQPTCKPWYNGGNVPGKRMYGLYQRHSRMPASVRRDRGPAATAVSSWFNRH